MKRLYEGVNCFACEPGSRSIVPTIFPMSQRSQRLTVNPQQVRHQTCSSPLPGCNELWQKDSCRSSEKIRKEKVTVVVSFNRSDSMMCSILRCMVFVSLHCQHRASLALEPASTKASLNELCSKRLVSQHTLRKTRPRQSKQLHLSMNKHAGLVELLAQFSFGQAAAHPYLGQNG